MPRDWKETQIAPGFDVAAWYALRDMLNDESYDDNWETAITLIDSRLRKRFVDPARVLIQHENEEIQHGSFPEGLGFSVLAIDCLLIETLIGYRRGKPIRAGETGAAFKEFLSTQPPFNEAFADPNRAETFSNALRNGILHDGETRKGWIIRKGSEDGPLIAEAGGGLLRLYRDAFHRAVEQHFNDYLQLLRAPGAESLRANLKKRIDQLCVESAPVQ